MITGPPTATARHTGARWLITAVLVAAGAWPASARQVDVPLRLDHSFIQQAIVDQVFGGSNHEIVLWDDGYDCGSLRLWDPGVSSAGNRIRLVSRGVGRAGTTVFGWFCLVPIDWDGYLELIEEPEIVPDRTAVQFRVVDSNLYDKEWNKPAIAGKLWDTVKDYVQPRFQAVRIDVATPLRDLREVLPLVIGAGDNVRIQELLATLYLRRAEATSTGVTLTVSFDVSPLPAADEPLPEPTLTPEELQRWEAAWQRWDAFLTFVIKVFGREATTPELRRALSDTLIEARMDILEALAPSTPGASDPTPALFLKTWERLAPVVRQSAIDQPGGAALRYLSFITAGDALAALEQMGPDIGLDISADGLRRLARIVAPADTTDPLVYSTEVDPELRDLFGLGPPLPSPEIPPDADGDTGWWWPSWLHPRPALAETEGPPSSSLEQWLPSREMIDTYLQAVRAVLDEATAQSLKTSKLDSAQRELYRKLVLATAWIESCWRQFVRQGGKVTFLRSPVGSVGMMQINEKVWRGLYDLRGLRWDVRYNGRAGAQILMHYLQDYALARKEQLQPGGLNNLARATYAVYNGGPGHLARYRKPTTSKSLRHIDDSFWEKYQAVQKGRELEVRVCIVGE